MQDITMILKFRGNRMLF
uniref:Uncharacterized protein n=1 Tax=Rhizophora mucronata TaxID=61149 RepID=A0A2P2PSY0_RHIMU